jgi:hypothetical protein
MRNNGTFQYKEVQPSEKGANGFYNQPAASEWLPGCECYIEKHIPAKQLIGEDGRTFSYTYEVFIPKHFRGVLNVTTPFQISCEDGSSDVFSILGVDNLNKRCIIVWG